MAQQLINRGTVQDDPNADTLFVAFGKVNANDSDLYGKFSALAAVATTGAYADLSGKPTLGTLAGLNSASLTANVTGILPLANGGTNNNATPSAGTLIWSDGTKFTSDTNLTWSATTGLLSKNGISSQTNGSSVASEVFGFGAIDASTQTPSSNTVIGPGASQNSTFATDCFVAGGGASLTTSNFSIMIAPGGTVSGSGQSVVIAPFGSLTNSANCVLLGYQTEISGGAVLNIGFAGRADHQNCGVLGALGQSQKATELSWGSRQTASEVPSFRMNGCTSTAFDGQDLWQVKTAWIDATSATRKARAIFSTYDTAEREYMRADANGAGADVFFNGNSVSIAGAVSFGVFTASALAPVTGYISITDNTGNVRHLACV